jgi:hypothetical protein
MPLRFVIRFVCIVLPRARAERRRRSGLRPTEAFLFDLREDGARQSRLQ